MAVALTSLCALYDKWGKADKSQLCPARLVSLEEKQFGATSTYLVRDLTAEAQTLRQLGRVDEASKIESRTQAIQSAQRSPRWMACCFKGDIVLHSNRLLSAIYDGKTRYCK